MQVFIITEHDGRVTNWGTSLGWEKKENAEKALARLNRYRASDRLMRIHAINVTPDDSSSKKFLMGD